MLKLSENVDKLRFMERNLRNLEEINALIAHYSDKYANPAQVKVFVQCNPEITFSKEVMLAALTMQRERIIKWLADLQIDANA